MRARNHRTNRSVRIVGALVIVAVAGLANMASAQSASPKASPAAGPASKIKHVILFFQENRSFDEVLGSFCQPARCDGYIGKVKLSNGTTVAMTKSPDLIAPDVSHTVTTQTRVVDGGKMDGWDKIPSCIAKGVNRCLSYYTPSQIPALSSFADKYVVSDHTFSMNNSPSWGGHVYAVAASQDGFTGDIPRAQGKGGPGWGCDSHKVSQWIDPTSGKMSFQPSCIPAPAGTLNPSKYPFGGAFEKTPVKSIPTIMDRLDAKQLSWKLYTSVWQWAVCPNFGKCLFTSQRDHMVKTDSILNDARNGNLPAFSVLLPTGPGSGGTGQHPDHPMSTGDNWIGQVVKAVQAGPDWSSTAIFITYDDCGCFYDHVPPGRNPDGTVQGIRVPMVIISPYAKHGATDNHPATLASFLRFTEEAFNLAPLGVNDTKAYDYSGSFNFAQAPTAGRVWPAPTVMPAAEQSQVAKIPPDEEGDDPT